MTDRNRVQSGVREGGQFAPHQRADADPSVQLEDPNPLVASGQAERVYVSEVEPGDVLTASGGTVRKVERLGGAIERVAITDSVDGRLVHKANQTTLITTPTLDANRDPEAMTREAAATYGRSMFEAGKASVNPALSPAVRRDASEMVKGNADHALTESLGRTYAEKHPGLPRVREAVAEYGEQMFKAGQIVADPAYETRASDMAVSTVARDAWAEFDRKLTGAGAQPATPYVLVEYGKVANTPTLPVLDLDVFEEDQPGADTYRAVDTMRATAQALGLDDIHARAQTWLAEHDKLRPAAHTPAELPHLEPAGEGDSYVVFEYGQVTNAPAVPVLNLGFMVDWPSDDDLSDAYQTINIANQVGLHDLAGEIEEWAAAYSDDDGYLSGDD